MTAPATMTEPTEPMAEAIPLVDESQALAEPDHPAESPLLAAHATDDARPSTFALAVRYDPLTEDGCHLEMTLRSTYLPDDQYDLAKEIVKRYGEMIRQHVGEAVRQMPEWDRCASLRKISDAAIRKAARLKRDLERAKLDRADLLEAEPRPDDLASRLVDLDERIETLTSAVPRAEREWKACTDPFLGAQSSLFKRLDGLTADALHPLAASLATERAAVRRQIEGILRDQVAPLLDRWRIFEVVAGKVNRHWASSVTRGLSWEDVAAVTTTAAESQPAEAQMVESQSVVSEEAAPPAEVQPEPVAPSGRRVAVVAGSSKKR